jgi:twitching motility two-component system response regulator PilG
MVARSLAPYIERGLLSMIDPPRPVSQPKPISPWDTYPSITLPQVVCIDDERTVGKQTELILSRQGYVVSYFNDPLEALQQLFQLKPDLILCDISMPKLDGYEICAMLRHSIVFRQTPIIMLTGKDAFMDRVRAHLVGATDYLTKPFGEGELLLLLESYLPVQHL